MAVNWALDVALPMPLLPRNGVCGHEDARWKRIELDAQYPNLCPTLEEIRGEWARAKAGNGTAGKSGSDEDAAFCGFITSRHHAFSLNQVGAMPVVGR